MINFEKEEMLVRREMLDEFFKQHSIVEVTFTKVNGEKRTMPCTLDTKQMPPIAVNEHHKTKLYKPEVMSVYCVDKDAWRSFRVENVISVKPLEV